MQAIIRSLKLRLEGKCHGDDNEERLEKYASTVTKPPQAFDLPVGNLPIEAGDVSSTAPVKELDQGYFSIPLKSNNPANSSQLLSHHESSLTPTTSSMQLSCNSIATLSDTTFLSSLLSSSERNETSFRNFECQTDLTLFGDTENIENDEFIILQADLKYKSKPERRIQIKGIKKLSESQIMKLISKILILITLWESTHDHILDFHAIWNSFVWPKRKKYKM